MINNLTDKQKKIAIVIALICMIVAIYFIYYGRNNENLADDEESVLVKTTNDIGKNDEESNTETMVIHIAGAVKNPGVVRLKEGARIEDAINLAGGLSEDADITNVNLAYVLDDGIKINIPRTSLEEDSIQEQDIIQDGSGELVIDKTLKEEKENRTNKYK